jgi:hypothetical protein
MDIPYIYNTLLNNNTDAIIEFTSKFIDTRFLCEYVRKSLNIHGKCSIYDALLYFNTINKTQHITLTNLNDQMGPIHKVNWSLHNPNAINIKYAYYDVLYLNDLPKDIFKKILLDTPQYTRTYYYILKIIRFVMLERKKITHVLDFIKTPPSSPTYNKYIDNCILKENNNEIHITFILTNDYIKIFGNVLKYVASTTNLEPLYTTLNKYPKLIPLLKLFKQNYTQYLAHS